MSKLKTAMVFYCIVIVPLVVIWDWISLVAPISARTWMVGNTIALVALLPPAGILWVMSRSSTQKARL